MKRHTLLSVLCTSILLLALSCQRGGGPLTDPKIAVKSVAIKPAELTMERGGTQALKVVVSPSNADNRAVVWSADPSDVLRITPKALDLAEITALAEGEVTVTVKTVDGGFAATCKVSVAKAGPDPDPEPGPGPDPKPVVTGYGSYYELPAVQDSNKDAKHDTDANLYYAQHHFKMGGKSYRNYTVCFSEEDHCPLWVAAPRHDVYTGSTGRTDNYKADPVIEAAKPGIQYVTSSVGCAGYNKGHMLGSAERTCCTEANQQVFNYSNIAPQLMDGFNTGKGGWNIVEDYVDTQVCADTLYEVVGAHFKQYTDAYGKSSSPKKLTYCGLSGVSHPTMFYYVLLRTKSGNSGKALKDCSASELKCVALVRTHTNDHKGQAVTEKDFMSVSDLEKITGVSYFSNVPQAPKSTYSVSDWK